MPDKTEPTFQQVVCSTSLVRDTFSSYPALRGWWQIILFLHGKPRNPQMNGAERIHCVANGFRFYAWLYRVLSLVFIGLAGAFIALRNMGSEEISTYWIGASALGAIYLWVVSGLGYYGAKAYGAGQSQSSNLLVCFMVMIVAFLSLFVAALSVVTHYLSWVGNAWNLVSMAALFVFGVGSYMIEILYLTTQGREDIPSVVH